MYVYMYIFISPSTGSSKKERKEKNIERRNYKRNYIRTESDAENPTCQTNTDKSYAVSSRPDKSFITNSLHAVHTILSDLAYLCKNFRFLLTIISEIAQQSNIDIHSMAVAVYQVLFGHQGPHFQNIPKTFFPMQDNLGFPENFSYPNSRRLYVS